MTTFNDREKGFENMFAHDEEMQFKAVARRNRLLGLWAASLLGKTGDDGRRLRDGGGQGRFRRVRRTRTSSARSPAISTHRADEATIRAKMAEFLAVAKSQILSETGS